MTDSQAGPAAALEVRNLNVFYGPIQAVFDANFSVPSGAIITLLGSNGAGKTTILRSLVGLISATGHVLFRGQALGGMRPEQRVARGMAMVADDRLLFPTLTVTENLRAAGFRLPRSAVSLQVNRAFEYFPALAERRRQLAGSLSGGQAQMLAIGRALVTQPTLLLLDEPSQGLAPKIVADLFATITRLSSEMKLSILLVEQNAGLALDVAQYGYVLANGRIELEGETRRLRNDDAVRRLYLGD